MLFHGLATPVVRLWPIACAVTAALHHHALHQARHRLSYLPVSHLAHRALLAPYIAHVSTCQLRAPARH